jgi:O-antigen ligase
MRRSSGAGAVLYGILTAASLSIGLATESDALTAAWVAGAVVLLGAAWFYQPRRRSSGLASRGLVRMVVALTLAIVLTAAGDKVLATARDSVESNYDKGGQGSNRTMLWAYALEAASHSPIVGLGPGAHSGETGPHQEKEAHNTFVDWTASTGIVGLGALAWMTIRVLRLSAASREFFGVVAMLCLGVFACFHHVLRHPTGWFDFVAIASMPYMYRPPRERSARARGAVPKPGTGGRVGRRLRVPGAQGASRDGAANPPAAEATS